MSPIVKNLLGAAMAFVVFCLCMVGLLYGGVLTQGMAQNIVLGVVVVTGTCGIFLLIVHLGI